MRELMGKLEELATQHDVTLKEVALAATRVAGAAARTPQERRALAEALIKEAVAALVP